MLSLLDYNPTLKWKVNVFGLRIQVFYHLENLIVLTWSAAYAISSLSCESTQEQIYFCTAKTLLKFPKMEQDTNQHVNTLEDRLQHDYIILMNQNSQKHIFVHCITVLTCSII